VRHIAVGHRIGSAADLEEDMKAGEPRRIVDDVAADNLAEDSFVEDNSAEGNSAGDSFVEGSSAE